MTKEYNIIPALAGKELKLKALQENFFAHLLFVPEHMQSYSVLKAKELIVTSSQLADIRLNNIFRARLDDKNVSGVIQSTVGYFKREGLPCRWWVTPSDRPKELAELLQLNGLANQKMYRGMIVTVAERGFEQAELHVERVLNMTQLEQVGEVFFDAYGDAPAMCTYFERFARMVLSAKDYEHIYLGYLDERPVSFGRLTCYAGVAGIHQLVTVHSEQREIFGKAMLQDMLMHAQMEGFENAVVVSASEKLCNAFEHLGAQELCSIGMFAL